MLTGVILAGGRSTRMGRDKLQLEVGDRTLLERVAEVLARACDEVLLVGRSPATLPTGVRAIADLRPGRAGPLAGIEAGLHSASHRAVFVAAADMPFVSERVVRGLAALLSDSVRVAVPRYAGRPHPLCAAYDRCVLAAVSAQLDRNERSVRQALEHCDGVEYVEGNELRRLGDPDLYLMNVNSPEDLTRARRLAR